MAIFAALLVVLGVAVPAPAERLPARRGPRHADRAGQGTGRRDAATHDAVDARSSSSTSGRTRLTRSKRVMAIQGFSFGGTGQNNGTAFVKLKDWDERKRSGIPRRRDRRPGNGATSVSTLRTPWHSLLPHRAIPELGIAAGFDFFLMDNAGLGHQALVAARNEFLGMAAQSRLLVNVRPNGQDDTPQFHIDVDTKRAAALGPFDRRHQQHAVDGLGWPVHRRLRRSRSREARLPAGRGTVSHVARGFQALVGAQ